MDLQSKRYVVEFEDAKFTFKMGDYRDLMMIIKSKKEGIDSLLSYFESRCLSVENLNIDGVPATVRDVMDLPRDVLAAIMNAWVNETCKVFDIDLGAESKNFESGESKPDSNGSSSETKS